MVLKDSELLQKAKRILSDHSVEEIMVEAKKTGTEFRTYDEIVDFLALEIAFAQFERSYEKLVNEAVAEPNQ